MIDDSRPEVQEEKPESLTFHYDLSRRLERAPESVRRAYAEGYTPNKGFIKGLTANAGLRSILLTIVILCAAIAFLTFFGNPPGSTTVAGCQFVTKAFLYEESVYVSVSAQRKAVGATTQPEDEPSPFLVALEGLDPDGNVACASQLTGTVSSVKTSVRTILTDYDLKAVRVFIRYKGDESSQTVAVDRN